MGFRPNAIGQGDLAVATRPALSGEGEVFVSPYASMEVAEITVPSLDTGEQENKTDYNFPTAGAHLVAVVRNKLNGTTAPTLTFAGTDEDGNAMTGEAVFNAPSWAVNRQNRFAEGYAVDVVPSTAGKRWKTIGLTGVSGGVEAGSKVMLIEIPDLTTFERLTCVTDLRVSAPYRETVTINCGMETTFVKPGRRQQGTLSGTHKERNPADGFARYNGQRVTVRVDTMKEGTVLTSRAFYTNTVFGVETNMGDGSAEVTQAANNGAFENMALLVAP